MNLNLLNQLMVIVFCSFFLDPLPGPSQPNCNSSEAWYNLHNIDFVNFR